MTTGILKCENRDMPELSDAELGQVTAGHPGADVFQAVFGVAAGVAIVGAGVYGFLRSLFAGE